MELKEINDLLNTAQIDIDCTGTVSPRVAQKLITTLRQVKNIAYEPVLAPVASENRKEVLICENCKTFWIAPMDRCDCGSTTLTRTHGGNYKLARNWG